MTPISTAAPWPNEEHGRPKTRSRATRGRTLGTRVILKQKWTPILTGETARRGWQAVEAVSQALLSRNDAAQTHATTPQCCYENALLCRYLAAATNEQHWVNRAHTFLNEAIDDAQSLVPSLGLFAGLGGLGWTIEHLSRFDSREAGDDQDSNVEIDAAILRTLERGLWPGPYDLISGLVGFGVYFLERLPAENAIRGIKAVISQLESLARHTGQGITWHTRADLLPDWQRERYPQGYYNLGVAHGVPGVLYFLAEVAERGVDERAEGMLGGAMAWFLMQRRPRGSLSWFPPWIATEEPSDTRLAWCYGDLGIAGVLLGISRRAGRADWRTFAEGLVENCLAWPVERAGVNEAPLCHGAAGAAHIFNRIYQDEGDERRRDAANAWFERALAMWRPGSGVGGFSVFTLPDPNGPVVWKASPALLDGSLGVALALLAGLTPIEPQWDRLMLLSARA